MRPILTTILLALACTPREPAVPSPVTHVFVQPALILPVPYLLMRVRGVTWVLIEPSVVAPLGVTWTERAPGTFVSYRTAPAPPLDRPRAFTLVGPDSHCVVTTTDTAHLQTSAGVARVIEIAPATCPGHPVIAVHGVAEGEPRALGRFAGQQAISRATTQWVERVLGVRLHAPHPVVDEIPEPGVRFAFLEPIPGTDVEAIYAFQEGPAGALVGVNNKQWLLLRRRDQLIAQLPGGYDLVGHLVWAGRGYVVVEKRGAASVIPID